MITKKYFIFIMNLTDAKETGFNNWQIDNMSYDAFDHPTDLNQVVYQQLLLGNLVETRAISADYTQPNTLNKIVTMFLISKGLR